MSFDEILGQAAATDLLTEALTKERVASGYLFFGPDGVGKRTTAIEFARAVLCRDQRLPTPCGECPSCIRSRAGSHPGLIFVERDKSRTRIRIEQIHDLGARLALRPMEGDSTVVIINEVERANLESLNALLKTLEEPPPGATIILVSMNRNALPETIRSRCQSVRFRPLPRPIVTKILSSMDDVDPALLDELVARASGSPGRALRLLELGYPESGRAIREALSNAEETDPVALAETLLGAMGKAGDARDRVREVLMFLIDEVRLRYLDADVDPRDPERAEEALGPLTQALERINLNVNPESVLRSAVIRIHEAISCRP